ncbi:hypothetical protein [Pseudomonas gingeri]
MSPHILIDDALEGLGDDDCPSGNDILVQALITRFFTDDAITAEEFNHYCRRLMRSQRIKEAA